MILTPDAFLALAMACAPDLDPNLLLAQARKESGLNTLAVNDRNANGSIDYGVMQINSRNFALLGVHSAAELFEPCRNLRAADDLYKTLSRYNSGRPTAALGYAHSILDSVSHNEIAAVLPPPQPPPCAPAWDAWALAACTAARRQPPAKLVVTLHQEPVHAQQDR